MDPISPSVTASDWVSDPAAALSSTVDVIAGIAHSHPIVGWLLIGYLGLLAVSKKIELPEPWGMIVHVVSNLLWFATSSKAQNNADVQAITHSQALGAVLGWLKTSPAAKDVEDGLIAKLHEPLRSEVIKMLADPDVMGAFTASATAVAAAPVAGAKP